MWGKTWFVWKLRFCVKTWIDFTILSTNGGLIRFYARTRIELLWKLKNAFYEKYLWKALYWNIRIQAIHILITKTQIILWFTLTIRVFTEKFKDVIKFNICCIQMWKLFLFFKLYVRRMYVTTRSILVATLLKLK